MDLPPSLAVVHDIFHVSQLNQCLKAHVDVVLPEVTPLEADLSYPEHPIKFFKIQWSNHFVEEEKWESKDFLRSCHSDFELP
jgi:hypothetical protein